MDRHTSIQCLRLLQFPPKLRQTGSPFVFGGLEPMPFCAEAAVGSKVTKSPAWLNRWDVLLKTTYQESASLEEEKCCLNLNLTDGKSQTWRWEDEASGVFFLSRWHRSVFQTHQQNSKTTSEHLPNATRRYPVTNWPLGAFWDANPFFFLTGLVI